MKSIFSALVFSLIFFTGCIYAQNSTYTGGIIQVRKYGVLKPLGKNVVLKYDSFFKSYNITYSDVNGSKITMLFEYNNPESVLYQDVEYHVNNEFLESKGEISFFDKRKISSLTLYQITNLKLKKQ